MSQSHDHGFLPEISSELKTSYVGFSPSTNLLEITLNALLWDEFIIETKRIQVNCKLSAKRFMAFRSTLPQCLVLKTAVGLACVSIMLMRNNFLVSVYERIWRVGAEFDVNSQKVPWWIWIQYAALFMLYKQPFNSSQFSSNVRTHALSCVLNIYKICMRYRGKVCRDKTASLKIVFISCNVNKFLYFV